jgi:hypothetical protein
MKNIPHLFTISFICIVFLFYPLSAQIVIPDKGPKKDDIHISIKPTGDELTEEFRNTTTGIHDPFTVLSLVSSRKDDAVPGLDAFLFSVPKMKKKADTIQTVEPNKQYGVLSLQRIGTPNAYAVLNKAALTHPDKEVRGRALACISINYYNRMRSDSAAPNMDYLRTLLQQCDDTTYVEFCHKRIGEIARIGIKNWTGRDYGVLSLKDKTIKMDKDKPPLTMAQYRAWEWDNVFAKFKWDKKNAKYKKDK